MPRLPIDYSKTVIYKIVANDLSITDCYVGSTTDFVRRKAGHKSICTNEKGRDYNLKVYKTIRDNGGWAEWCMVEIEKYPCNDVNEATSRERYWFEILNSDLNSQYPQRSKAEFYKDNRDRKLLYQKQYRKDHIDEITKYEEEHKNERSLKSKQRYDNNRDEMMIRARETCICQCGNHYSYNGKTNHSRTIFHKHYMKTVMQAPDTTISNNTTEFDPENNLNQPTVVISPV